MTVFVPEQFVHTELLLDSVHPLTMVSLESIGMYDNSFPWVLYMLDAVYHIPNLFHNFEWALPRAMKLWTFSSGDSRAV